MMKDIGALIYFELLHCFRRGFDVVTPLLFFTIVISLFPIATSTDPQLLMTIAPGIIWVAALLATLLSSSRMFSTEVQDGSMDAYILSPHPLTLLISIKIISHWLIYCLPLIIVTPILGLLLHIPGYSLWVLIMTLLLGTPVLSLLGAIGAALTAGVQNHGLLLPILILPLYIPILIFATGTVIQANAGLSVHAYYAIMGALILISLAFAPLASSAALRIGVQQ